MIFSEIFSQNVHILDNFNKPISSVNAFNKTTYSISNENGIVDLSKFSENDSISFSHINFVDTTIQKSKIGNILHLKEKHFQLDTVLVLSNSDEKKNINLSNLSTIYNFGIDDILSQNTSFIFIKSGGENAFSTIFRRGLTSDNFLVLFNEAQINDLRSGSFDFSQISPQVIENIEITNGNSNGFSAAGGILNLSTKNFADSNKFELGSSISSDKLNSLFANYSVSFNNFSANFGFNRSYSPNKYSFIFDEKLYSRENADFSKTLLYSSLSYLDIKTYAKFYIHFNDFKSGLPGFVVTNNQSSAARNENRNLLATINLTHNFSSFFHSEIHSGYQFQILKLLDPNEEILTNQLEQTAKLNNFSIQNRNSFSFGNLKLNFGENFLFGKLQNSSPIALEYLDNLYSATKSEFSLYLRPFYTCDEFSIFNSLQISAEINSQFVKNEIIDNSWQNYFSKDVKTNFSFKNMKNFSFLFHYSDSFRLPNFTELYYSTTFSNSKLLPENYSQILVGLNYNSELFTANFEIFNIFGNNKIIWVPTRLALQIPKNVKKTITNGFELNLNIPIFKNNLTSYFIYSYTDARNISAQSQDDNSYNKQLLYSSLHNLKSGINARWNGFSASLFHQFSSEKFYTTDNNPIYKIPFYNIFDLNLAYQFNLYSTQNSLSFAIENLTNENYLIIQSYPMPLRSFTFTYKMTL